MIRKLRETVFVFFMKTYKANATEYVLFQTNSIDSAPPNIHSLSVSHSALSYGKSFSGQMENKYLLLSLKDIETSSPTYTSLVGQRHVVLPSSYICSNHDVSLSSQCEKKVLISPLFKVSPVCVYFKPQANPSL